VLTQLAPGLAASPAHFAIAGMAAMVGGTTGAALTATIMVFEMTRDYTASLPVILTVTIASVVRQGLSPATIYTLKLLRRGHVVPQGLQARLGELRSRHVMTADFELLPEAAARNPGALRRTAASGRLAVLTGEDGRVRRVVAAAAPADDATLSAAHVTVGPDARLHEVLRTLREADAEVALVMQPQASTAAPRLVGVITQREIAGLARDTARLID
jgi:CIC family chloride channel protein